MSWDFESSTGTPKAEFTKFPVGVTRIRVIDGEPNVRWTHWMQQHKRSINCPGKNCPICEIRRYQKANKEPYSHPMSRRFAINIYNYETEKVEIMEQGIGFFQDLRDLMQDLVEQGKSLSDAIIKVRRRGTGKDDTSYRLDIEEITPISDKEKELANKKTNLQEYFKPHTVEQITRIINGEAWEDVMRVEDNDDKNSNEDIEIK